MTEPVTPTPTPAPSAAPTPTAAPAVTPQAPDPNAPPAPAPATDPAPATPAPVEPAAVPPNSLAPQPPKVEAPEFVAADYKIEVDPALGIKDEEGNPFTFADGDPFVTSFQDILTKHQAKPEMVQDLINLQMNMQKETAEAGTTANKERAETTRTAELAKLETKGEDGKTITAETRIEALMGSIDSVLGDGASTKLAPALTNAVIVELVEQLLVKSTANGFGTGNNPATGDRPPENILYGDD